MCDFCNLNENNKSFDIDQRSVCHITASINKIYRSAWINIEAFVDAGVFGGLNIEGNFDINYCPFCGKKLED